MKFICPQCGGHHFGTSLDTAEDEFGTVTDVTITEHQCHDQFKTGCKWKGMPDTMKNLNEISDIIRDSKRLLKLDWSQNYERPGTHIVHDGTMRYFTTPPEGASMDDVATAFLSGYDDGGTDDDVEFTLYRPSTDEEVDYTGKPDGIAERK